MIIKHNSKYYEATSVAISDDSKVNLDVQRYANNTTGIAFASGALFGFLFGCIFYALTQC